MRKLFDDVKISEQEISDIMANDIIKREIIDSEESKKAKKDIDKIYKKLERVKEKNSTVSSGSINSESNVKEEKGAKENITETEEVGDSIEGNENRDMD
jgi:hypothetical protein